MANELPGDAELLDQFLARLDAMETPEERRNEIQRIGSTAWSIGRQNEQTRILNIIATHNGPFIATVAGGQVKDLLNEITRSIKEPIGARQ